MREHHVAEWIFKGIVNEWRSTSQLPENLAPAIK